MGATGFLAGAAGGRHHAPGAPPPAPPNAQSHPALISPCALSESLGNPAAPCICVPPHATRAAAARPPVFTPKFSAGSDGSVWPVWPGPLGPARRSLSPATSPRVLESPNDAGPGVRCHGRRRCLAASQLHRREPGHKPSVTSSPPPPPPPTSWKAMPPAQSKFARSVSEPGRVTGPRSGPRPVTPNQGRAAFARPPLGRRRRPPLGRRRAAAGKQTSGA